MLHLLALWLLVRVAGRLPARALHAAATLAAALAWALSPRLRSVTADHMRHALGPAAAPRALARAARGCVRSAAYYYADFAKLPYLRDAAPFDAVTRADGLHHWFDAADRGCGVIALSAHLGNPEFFCRAVAAISSELLILTEPLRPPRLDRFVQATRATPGVRFAPAGLAGARAAIEVLRRGGAVAVLGDRDVLGTGTPVAFFGERAPLPTGVAELALRTGAAVVPAFALRDGSGFRVVFDPPLALRRTGNRAADLAAAHRAVAAALQRGIARAPEQWFALSPVWSGLAR